MRHRWIFLFAAGLLAVALPRFAQTVEDNQRGDVVKAAVAEADKAIQANEANKARFHLLAVVLVGYDDMGWRDAVPKDVQAQYEAAAAKAWPDEKVAADKEQEVFAALDKLVKASDEKLTRGYPNIVNIVGSLSHSSTREIAGYFIEAEKKRPEAMEAALEFAAQVPSPPVFNKYKWRGREGFAAGAIVETLYNLQVGPSLIATHAKDDLLPAALKEAEEWLDKAARSPDPDVITSDVASARTPLDWALWADAEDPKAAELQGKVKVLMAKAQKIRAQQIKANRVPGEGYKGGDAAALKTQMRQAYEKENAGQKVLRVSITGDDWVERAVVTTAYNNIQAGIYRFLDAAVVAKEGAKFRVHPITFARKWTGSGDKFGELKVYSWADAYEILEANVGK